MILWELFGTFLKIGFLGFGGGYAVLALIFDEAEKLGITPAQFADLNALDLLAPGPIAVNAATFIGYQVHQYSGALLASAGVCVSSVVFVVLYLRFEDRMLLNPVLATFLTNIQKIAIALIASVALSLFAESLNLAHFSAIDVTAALAMVSAFLMRFVWKVNPILVILFCGAIGGLLTLI